MLNMSTITPRPNFILVMCDDMDLVLGGVNATPQVKSILGDGGATASNYFVSSPKCTPSRSAWLSGRHYHNLRPHGATTGLGLNTSSFFDEDAVFPTLRRAGYTTGIFGKIHNDQGRWLCNPDNHTEPFDHIETECSPCGGYYRTGVNDWVRKDTHDSVPQFETLDPASPYSNYSEAQYGNRTVAWITKLVDAGQLPFFAFIGTSGPHLGVVPAPWHRRRTAELSVLAPRTPNFNVLAADHHPLLSTAPPFNDEAIAHLDLHMRDRWGTLFSIDDMVTEVAGAVDTLGIHKSTYIFFTSDRGYHLGQFRIPDEKMMPYETDVRVPFFARGPRIAPGTQLNQLISNIDLAPTLCDLAGIAVPNIMDGRSMVPLLTGSHSGLDRPWRTHFMIEFAEGGTQEWGTNGRWTTDFTNPTFDSSVNPPWGIDAGNNASCDRVTCPPNPCADAETCPHAPRSDYAYDDPSYNWRALRVLNSSHDFTFAQWDPAYRFGAEPPPGPPPPPPIKPSTLMANVDIVGHDQPSPCPAAAYNNTPALCEASCKGKVGCVAWTLHRNTNVPSAPGWRCCTKTHVVSLRRAPGMTSGILHPDSVDDALVATETAEGTETVEATGGGHALWVTYGANPGVSGIAFSEFYDNRADPWQLTNLWLTLSEPTQAALMAEIAIRSTCGGTRDTPSTCE